jgi:WD40 repeat protein
LYGFPDIPGTGEREKRYYKKVYRRQATTSLSVMHNSGRILLCGVALLLLLAGPAACATTPLWVEDATVGGELSGVVISADGSSIVTGGDQLISLTRDGRKRWSGWSGTSLDISSQGDYILTSRGTVVRLISGAGTLLWDKNMEIAVKDISMAPDLSLIAAAGGGKVRTLTFSGEGIASNETLTINQVRIMPSGNRVLITTSRGAMLLDQKLMPEWEDTNSSQNLVAIAPGGSLFVTATSNRVRMYTGNGSIVWDKRYPVGDVQALAWSRDGSTIILGLNENVVALNRYGAQLFMANATDWITSVAVSDDGNTIAAGSLDKTLYVWNHAGSMLGTFKVKNAIRPNSVAVTGDGQLIVLVAQSAVYAFSRSSFTEGTATTGTVTGTITETAEESITTTTLPLTTTRKITARATTLPTPYPVESSAAEAALPPLIPVAALLLILLLCRKGTR